MERRMVLTSPLFHPKMNPPGIPQTECTCTFTKKCGSSMRFHTCQCIECFRGISNYVTCLPSGWGSPLWTSFQVSLLQIRKGPLVILIIINRVCYLIDVEWLSCAWRWLPRTSGQDPGYILALEHKVPLYQRAGRRSWFRIYKIHDNIMKKFVRQFSSHWIETVFSS